MTDRILTFDDSREFEPVSRTVEPPAAGRWLLAVVTLISFVALQLIFMIPVMLYAAANNAATTDLEAPQSMVQFLGSETGVLLTVLAAAASGVITTLIAFGWPHLWNLMSRGPRFSTRDWLAWRSPTNLPLRLIPFVTLPLLFGLALIVSRTFGNTQVDAQLGLFSTPVLRIVSAIVVALIAPISEEVVFRGALYGALLGSEERAETDWTRHIVPFVVTSLAFAALHLMAGFERLGSIILILLFSIFLTGLRTYTGSLKSSVIGHMVWNTIGAISLIAANLGLFPG